MFSSILIANRGEIACRIAKTAKRMGMRVIAVYSQADENAMHVKLAHEAHLLGPAPASESYLCGDKILAIAAKTNAQCIHPGYGFLSENAEFAEKCAQQGIKFVGPPSQAILDMGLKDKAKDLMQKAGVPVVPGYQGSNQDAAFLKQKAREIGYPVMIKAIAGGGGKGMRQVNSHADFGDALISCQREAKASFGNDHVLIEKFISNPRHIEMQIFGDSHGNVVHLFERDCSLQRRHQKVIEEAPAPGMTKEVRTVMGSAAIAAATAVKYEGAGTVEFIVDGSDGLKPDGFFFMEMNTRLQVEHPVTEAITGYDLVEWQLLVAAGEKLPVDQNQITATGHAFEARVYAEEPANGFLPQTGKLHVLEWPNDDQARIDTGVEQDDVISPFYDPMIAKVIVHGKDRNTALTNLADTLENTSILGLGNNIGFLTNLARHRKFSAAKMDTGFIDENLSDLIGVDDKNNVLMAIACWVHIRTATQNSNSPWNALTGWTLSGNPRTDNFYLVINGENQKFSVVWNSNGFLIDDTAQISRFSINDGIATAKIGDTDVGMSVFDTGKIVFVSAHGEHFEIKQQDLLDRHQQAGPGSAIVKAPMPGKVIAVNVKQQQSVDKGEVLLVLEAMKMEHSLTAALSGVIDTLDVAIGDQVEDGQILVKLKPEAVSGQD